MTIEEIKKYAQEWTDSNVGVDPYYDMNCILNLIKELDETREEFNTLSRIYTPRPTNNVVIEEFYGDLLSCNYSVGSGGSGETK